MDESPPLEPPRRRPINMTVVTWIILAGAVVTFLLVKRLGQATPELARDWVNKGAVVIDVRSEGEYQERHLPGVINIPLDRLSEEISRYATNKDQPILLHCLSGTRSGMGASKLKRMGYSNVSNLGSYGRAEKIIGSSLKDPKKG